MDNGFLKVTAVATGEKGSSAIAIMYVHVCVRGMLAARAALSPIVYSSLLSYWLPLPTLTPVCMYFPTDPGYRDTARMLVEAGLVLALEPQRTQVRTRAPAAAGRPCCFTALRCG